jgi:hypothetical protein
LALERGDTGLASQEQCGGVLRKAGSVMVKINSKSLFVQDGASFHSFRVCSSSFHDLLREKPSSLFMLSGWSSISYCFPDDEFLLSGSHGQDPGVLK